MRGDNTTLGILQYNTHKSREQVMVPFLEDPRVKFYSERLPADRFTEYYRENPGKNYGYKAQRGCRNA
jgi:hypothetical protein